MCHYLYDADQQAFDIGYWPTPLPVIVLGTYRESQSQSFLTLPDYNILWPAVRVLDLPTDEFDYTLFCYLIPRNP